MLLGMAKKTPVMHGAREGQEKYANRASFQKRAPRSTVFKVFNKTTTMIKITS
jgi:hypothetical protein